MAADSRAIILALAQVRRRQKKTTARYRLKNIQVRSYKNYDLQEKLEAERLTKQESARAKRAAKRK